MDKIQNMQMFYNTTVQMDTVPTVSVDYNAWCVKSPFIQQLQQQVLNPCLKNQKIPQFVFDDAVNKIGVVAEKPNLNELNVMGIPVEDIYTQTKDTAVFNILGLNGWFDTKISLMTEVAQTQAIVHGFTGRKLNNANIKMLFTDYLLRSAICYVEVFRGNTVDKFYATRNVNLLAQLALTPATQDKKGKDVPYMRINKDLADNEIRKQLSTYLTIDNEMLQMSTLPYLKINAPTTKTKTYNVIMPRGALQRIDSKMQYRIIPVFFITAITKMLQTLMQQQIVELTYIKDTLQLRSIETTLNSTILMQLCNDSTMASDIVQKTQIDIMPKGYLKLPDLALIGTDNCIRSVALRVVKLKTINIADYKNIYSGNDITKTPSIFKLFVGKYRQMQPFLMHLLYCTAVLDDTHWYRQQQDAKKYYMQQMQVVPNTNAYVQIVQTIENSIKARQIKTQETVKQKYNGKTNEELYLALCAWCDYRSNKDSTTYYKQLHEFMLTNKQLFPNYIGLLQQTQNTIITNTNRIEQTQRDDTVEFNLGG